MLKLRHRHGLILDLFVLSILLALLLITPINTSIDFSHFVFMSTTLGLAIVLPYLIYKESHQHEIPFQFGLESGWTKGKFGWIAFGGLIGYLLFPLYFETTGAHINWPGPSDPMGIFLLFLGTNALGIWDELFFVNTLLRIFRRYLRFWIANTLQAIFWMIFLYELGFVGWIVPLTFIFALIQGYTFKLYHSLGYLIAIHLTVDFMLFLAILDAHGLMPFNIFLT